MKNINFKLIRNFLTGIFAILVFSTIGDAQVFSNSGSSAAAIQPTVNSFRASINGVNNGVGGSFTSGRREINWDGVPDDKAAPNNMPANFFNTTSPRGVVFSSVGSNGFMVSANQSSGTIPEFGNIDPSYPNSFQTFSSQRLFTGMHPPIQSASNLHRVIEVNFFIPGTDIPATVNAFGAIFCDVDSTGATGNTTIAFFRADGSQIESRVVPAFNNGLSFLGVRFDDERVARVVINNGNSNIKEGNTDGGETRDIVVMDDFIYSEPRAKEFHPGDFDGDGTADATVFRPATGQWFTLNSGSNTVSFASFGLNGDIPVNGDFDGDSRADVAIYRPGGGEWWIQRSTDGSTLGVQFGQNGDKPVVGDYDKDGKSDMAFWRPSNGTYFVLRSTNGSFFGFPFGSNGDVPIGASAP